MLSAAAVALGHLPTAHTRTLDRLHQRAVVARTSSSSSSSTPPRQTPQLDRGGGGEGGAMVVQEAKSKAALIMANDTGGGGTAAGYVREQHWGPAWSASPLGAAAGSTGASRPPTVRTGGSRASGGVGWVSFNPQRCATTTGASCCSSFGQTAALPPSLACARWGGVGGRGGGYLSILDLSPSRRAPGVAAAAPAAALRLACRLV